MADIANTIDPMERQIKFALRYYEEWNEMASAEQQSALDRFWEHKNIGAVNDMIVQYDGYQNLVKTMGKTAANKAAISGLNRLVAQEIVKASVGGITSATGRRGAVIIVEETAKLAAARGANVAINGGVRAVAGLPVGITAAVGEMVGDAIAKKAGIKNNHAKNAFGVGGAMAGGAAAGAVVGGPIGAAAGAAVGVGSWAVGQGIKALMRVGKGPGDNWCYVEIGDIGRSELWVGSYAADDTLYWKTETTFKGNVSNDCFAISACQNAQKSFQLKIFEGKRKILHLREVYYRDVIGIVKDGGQWRLVHCRGQFHSTESGEVHVYETD